MDIQLASTYSQACSGRKLIVTHSRLIETIKSSIRNLFKFKLLFYAEKVKQLMINSL